MASKNDILCAPASLREIQELLFCLIVALRLPRLQVDLADIVYIREFLDCENQNRNLELFLSSRAFSGELTIRHVQGSGPDEDYIRDARWVPKAELDSMVVYPD